MTGDRKCSIRPLYYVVAEHPNDHAVRAVFGGHYHFGAHWPPEQNLGAHVYATPASIRGGGYTEYIIATVTEKAVTFKKKRVAAGKDGRNWNKVVYRPILGKFPGADE